MLRRSPTTFGVLLSFASFAGLLTLLLLAQRTIPERTPLSQEPLPTEIVGPSLVTSPEEPSSETGTTAPGSSVLTVPGGPLIVAPVGTTGPSGQVNEPGTNPDKENKPGGKQPEPPADEPSPPAGQSPSPPGGPEEQPGGQPPSPPGVLPASTDADEDDDDGQDDDDTDDTDSKDGGAEGESNGNGGENGGDEGKSKGKDKV